MAPPSWSALELDRTTVSGLASTLHHAARQRHTLVSETNCYRLHDANADAISDLTVERYADYAVVNTYGKDAEQLAKSAGAALLELGARGVYWKLRSRADLRRVNARELAQAEPVAGEGAPEELEVFELNRRFLVRLHDGLSTGLFVDQRDTRTLLQQDCSGARVLNLFCYTGSFSVAAGLGGAANVTSVDTSSAILERADRNLRRNQLDPKRHRLLKADAVQWVARAVRRRERYDWIILDPPTFATVQRGSRPGAFTVARHYAELARDCCRLLAPEGRLIAVTNHRKTTRRMFHGLLRRAVHDAEREEKAMSWLAPPLDCPVGNDPDIHTKGIVVRVR